MTFIADLEAMQQSPFGWLSLRNPMSRFAM